MLASQTVLTRGVNNRESRPVPRHEVLGQTVACDPGFERIQVRTSRDLDGSPLRRISCGQLRELHSLLGRNTRKLEALLHPAVSIPC
jgi:hypothetical protein